MTKALYYGNGAAHGVEAALLAQAGFSANDDALGSPRGWGPSLFGIGFDPGPAWKLFPSQFATHFAITAALEAREAAGPHDLARRIRRVELRTPPMPYIDRPRPTSGLDGKFSWQYTAAVALLDGVVDASSFADARRFAADAVALLDRIALVGDPAISGRFDRMHVEITLDLTDGAPVTRRCDAPLGSWRRPIPSSRVRAKAEGLLGPVRAAEIAAMLAAPAGFEVRALMALL